MAPADNAASGININNKNFIAQTPLVQKRSA
jgi:hypothetical protein